MSKSLFIASRAGGANFADGTKRFQPISGQLFNNQVGSGSDRARVLIQDAGTIRNYKTFIVANEVSAGTPVGIQIDGADTSITDTIPADTTGAFDDLVNEEAVAVGEFLNYYVDPPAESGTNNLTPTYMVSEFEPDDDGVTVSKWVSAGTTVNHSAASETRYISPGAVINLASTSENNQKVIIQFAVVSQDFTVGVPSNARTTDTTFKTRVDNADGNQSVTYGSGETGTKTDTTNTDTLTAGEGFNYAVVTSTGTEIMNVGQVSSSLISSASQFHLLTADAAAVGVNSNLTRFVFPNGVLVFGAVEDNCEVPTSFDFTGKLLSTLVTANSITTSPSVITLRVNGADSSVTISYAAAETGTKTDTTNSVAISDTQPFCYQVVTPNTSGTISFRAMWMTGEVGGGTPPVAPTRKIIGVGISR